MGPLLTSTVLEQLLAARLASADRIEVSLDLQRSKTQVQIHADHWIWRDQRFPYPERCKERTIYHWTDTFEPVARYSRSLIKLIPTEWGPPTFEIDGIKMLPSAAISPYDDAKRKVKLIDARGKVVLDTCGGLGYFAAWCLEERASRVVSYEINRDVLWLRSVNPWSPPPDDRLTLTNQDVTAAVSDMPAGSIDAVLHDPPRFGIAGDLYSQAFYSALARVLKLNGRLFHYVGTPNRLTSGRDVPHEVSKRLRLAGFSVTPVGDGLLAVKR